MTVEASWRWLLLSTLVAFGCAGADPGGNDGGQGGSGGGAGASGGSGGTGGLGGSGGTGGSGGSAGSGGSGGGGSGGGGGNLSFPDGGTKAIPMPMIGRGLPAAASSGTAADAFDDDYDTNWRSNGKPTVGAPQWLAVNLNSVPLAKKQKVLLCWTNDDNYNFELNSPSDPAYNLPTDYKIEVNTSTSATAPTTGWTQVAAVTGNLFHSRSHVLDFAGQNIGWLRVVVTAALGDSQNDDASFNLDLSDASLGLTDSWLTLGDSITAGSLGHAAPCSGSGCTAPKSFSQLIHAVRPDFTPVQENGGIGGTTSADGKANMNRWLALSPARFVTLNYGANDAGGGCDAPCPAEFEANMRSMIEKLIASGRTPIVPKISWAREAVRQKGATRLNAVIDTLYAAYPKLMRGPDLYTYFQTHQSQISSDNLHPTQPGYLAVRQQWAAAMTSATGPYAP